LAFVEPQASTVVPTGIPVATNPAFFKLNAHKTFVSLDTEPATSRWANLHHFSCNGGFVSIRFGLAKQMPGGYRATTEHEQTYHCREQLVH